MGFMSPTLQNPKYSNESKQVIKSIKLCNVFVLGRK